MMTQILTCSKCCAPQSMWYDVVNSIPCFVTLLTICICAVFAIYIIAKYGVEWYRICKASKEKMLESSNGKCSIGEDIKKQLESFMNKEHQLHEENQVLKKKLTMMEELWGGYKEQLEKLYESKHTKSEDDTVGENVYVQETK